MDDDGMDDELRQALALSMQQVLPVLSCLACMHRAALSECKSATFCTTATPSPSPTSRGTLQYMPAAEPGC